MSFRASGVTTALFLWALVMMGIVQGATIAHEATTPAQASVSYNGTHVAYGTGNVTELDTNVSADTELDGDDPAAVRWLGTHVPDIRTPIDPYIERGVVLFTETMLAVSFMLAFGVADLSAQVFYHLQWLPLWLVSGALEIAAVAPVVGVVGVYLVQLREVL